MKNKFYNRTALVIFIIILFSSFISFPGLANRANAAYALYSYIRDFSVSATQMSYYQERDGYVCIRAFPYYPEYIDPEYPGDPPFPYTDYEHPTVIYRSQMELVGQKNLSWQERDEVGNAIEPGLYMFETMIYPLPNCGGWPISDYGEQAEFEIQAPEPPQSWSFAIISDLHVGEPGLDYGGPTWDDANSVGNDTIYSVKNLKKVIEQINSNKDKYNIKFVVVTGDFSDSGELSELIKAKEILNTLDPDITWIPLIGNHDVWPYYGTNPGPINREAYMAPVPLENQYGTDEYFYEIFRPKYEELKSILPNWEKEEIRVLDPDTEPFYHSHFENFFFDFNGYHFIGLDFNDRAMEIRPLMGASAEGNLHDFPMGTWDWLVNHLSQYINEHPESNENIILLAHHPFRKEYYKIKGITTPYILTFSNDELLKVSDSLEIYREKIYALFAGHTHESTVNNLSDILQIVQTAANIDGPLARIVQFFADDTISYSRMLGDGMRATTHSPVDLEFIDPEGLIINKLQNDIPGAIYTEEDTDGDGDIEDQITIPERKMGNYQVRVIPEPGASPDDTFSLEVKTLEDNFGYTPLLIAENIPISEIPSHYDVEIKQRQNANLIYQGELSGQYSDSVNLSATLTDKDGNPLVGKNIVFQIGEQTISAITNSSGIASASLILNQIPSKDYYVEASFVGDEDYLPSFDSKDFEILKENIVINVPDKEGFAFDEVILEAEAKDEEGQAPLPAFDIEFKIDSRVVGTSTIDELGIATSSWQVDIIPKQITESYLIDVIFAGNDYYESAQGQANFVLKSAKGLKQEAVADLEAAKTGNWLNDLAVEAAKRLIQDSLSDSFWLDGSHIIFFEKNCAIQGQTEVDPDKLDAEKLFNSGKTNGINKNCPWIKSGLRVFGEEFLAVKLLQKKTVYMLIIEKLVKADQLLAEVSLYDTKNTSDERRIAKAEEQLEKTEDEMAKNRPDKAIIRLTISWLHSQLAIKIANL